jgi:hypothetical protein
VLNARRCCELPADSCSCCRGWSLLICCLHSRQSAECTAGKQVAYWMLRFPAFDAQMSPPARAQVGIAKCETVVQVVHTRLQHLSRSGSSATVQRRSMQQALPHNSPGACAAGCRCHDSPTPQHRSRSPCPVQIAKSGSVRMQHTDCWMLIECGKQTLVSRLRDLISVIPNPKTQLHWACQVAGVQHACQRCVT